MSIEKYTNQIIESRTETVKELGNLPKPSLYNVGTTTQKIYEAATTPVILALADTWIGISALNPSRTNPDDRMFAKPDWWKKNVTEGEYIRTIPREQGRFLYDRMWYMQIGDYNMPMSQTYSLRAKKKLNTSSLVDGVDVIQQTRKESKTIDCTLRIGLNEAQTNLQILKEDRTGSSQIYDGVSAEVSKLSAFLQDFYENDRVLKIYNNEINNTFGVSYVIMSDYRFMPRPGMSTFTFEFTLVEVAYGDNVLTFNLREVDADAGTRRQIVQ